jgi:hypothetical protein
MLAYAAQIDSTDIADTLNQHLDDNDQPWSLIEA